MKQIEIVVASDIQRARFTNRFAKLWTPFPSKNNACSSKFRVSFFPLDEKKKRHFKSFVERVE